MKVVSGVSVAIIAFMLAACESSTAKSVWCVPERFLAPSSVMPDGGDDSNFDGSDEEAGPTLYFPAEFLAEQVPGYRSELTVSGGASLKQPMHVRVFGSAQETADYDESRGWRLMDAVPLYSASSKDSFGWEVVLDDSTEEPRYWGECYDDFQEGFTCMRTTIMGEHYLTYNVEKDNIIHYKKIDKFLTETVSGWMCS